MEGSVSTELCGVVDVAASVLVAGVLSGDVIRSSCNSDVNLVSRYIQ